MPAILSLMFKKARARVIFIGFKFNILTVFALVTKRPLSDRVYCANNSNVSVEWNLSPLINHLIR